MGSIVTRNSTPEKPHQIESHGISKAKQEVIVDDKIKQSEERNRRGTEYQAAAENEADEVKSFEVKVYTDPKDVWVNIFNHVEIPLGKTHPMEKHQIQRSPTEWRTIRIFVSSTFTDFFHEREVLVKQIFPELRSWCQNRRLRVLDIDLRWGVPASTTTAETLKICLEEIDRCIEENTLPYFINLTSMRAGWVPKEEDVGKELMIKYRLPYGLTITGMEIVHGAYTMCNPNALFLIRDVDGSIVERLKEEFPEKFYPAEKKKQTEHDILAELKKKIECRFTEDQIKSYKCTHYKVDTESGKPLFTFDPDDIFSHTVLNFFKSRISTNYPEATLPDDPYSKARGQQEAFMTTKAQFVLGRDPILTQIDQYICGVAVDSPLLVVGEAGSGKSAILAKAAKAVVEKAKEGKIPGAKDRKWHVFYHFVGAVPSSTELKPVLTRLLLELNIVTETTVPTDIESVIQLTSGILRNTSTHPVVIIVDALNQFDDTKYNELVSWLPSKLAPQVRVVVSMISGTPQHCHLTDTARKLRAQCLDVSPLSQHSAKEIITRYLSEYRKELDEAEMKLLLSKNSVCNPLWLILACEELRVYGVFRKSRKEFRKEKPEEAKGSGETPAKPANNTQEDQGHVLMIKQKISKFEDNLSGLLAQVLDRFQQEGGEDGSRLLVAMLCLLEVSATGLLETELLFLLSDEENLIPPVTSDVHDNEKGTRESSERENPKFGERLPHMKWVKIQNSLRPFLRPFGDIGEGRLDFYHRSISKVIRKKYLSHSTDYIWWHRMLANFFQQGTDYDRKTEELPIHLLHLKEFGQLRIFLSDWEVFDRLYDGDFSTKLFHYWRESGDKDLTKMKQCYSDRLAAMERDEPTTDQILGRRQLQVGQILLQNGMLEDAEILAEKSLRIEEECGSGTLNSPTEEGEKRTRRLFEINSLLADIWGQRSKSHATVCDEMKPDVQKGVDYNTEALRHLKLLTKTDQNQRQIQSYLGKRSTKLAFHWMQLDQVMGSKAVMQNGRTCHDECHTVIGDAKEIFGKLGDNGSLAELAMTEGLTHWRTYATKKQGKLFEEAWRLCLASYGEFSVLAGRIQRNWAIACHQVKDFKGKYEHTKWSYLIRCVVFGEDHQTTLGTLGQLREKALTKFHDENKLQEEVKQYSG